MEDFDFEQEAIRRSFSGDDEASKVCMELAISELLNGSLSPALQIWLGYKLSAIFDDKADPLAVLLLKPPKGRPKGCGSIRATDDEISAMVELIVMQCGVQRGMAHVLLGEAVKRDAETISEAVINARSKGFDYRGLEFKVVMSTLSEPRRQFISGVISEFVGKT